MAWKSSSSRSHPGRPISVHSGIQDIILAMSAPAPVRLLPLRSSFCSLQGDADSALVGLVQAWMLSAMSDISPASNLHPSIFNACIRAIHGSVKNQTHPCRFVCLIPTCNLSLTGFRFISPIFSISHRYNPSSLLPSPLTVTS